MPLVIFNLFREFIILRAVILGGLNEKLKKNCLFLDGIRTSKPSKQQYKNQH